MVEDTGEGLAGAPSAQGVRCLVSGKGIEGAIEEGDQHPFVLLDILGALWG